MIYQMLLWPHANARYQSETVKLAQSELCLTLSRVAPRAVVTPLEEAEAPSLLIECPEALDAAALAAIARHSLLYVLFERREDGALTPVEGRASAYLGSDLPAILKYKGKTNEMFLQLLINAALYAGDFWNAGDEPLELLDPMCGRGTGLFVAANRGWNATGADVDKADLKEAERFLKRYLEYHRVKHSVVRQARTTKRGAGVPVTRFEYADTPERFKAGEGRALRLAALDASRDGEVFGRNAFHLIACDLPYGVRHDAQLSGGDKGRNWLETLLSRALPGWRAALKGGGTVALSFNAQTMRRDRVRELLREAGFEVAEGGPFDGFEHWVEQAITRDIAIGRKAP